MCIIETRVYVSEDGTEQRVERAQLCSNARNTRPCNHIERREARAHLVETKPADLSRSHYRTSDNTVVIQDQHGRERAYRRLSSRREGKQPVSSRADAFRDRSHSGSPISPTTRAARIPAPSPPRPAHYHPLDSLCPRKDCPMMTSAIRTEERSPLASIHDENDFIRDLPEVGPSSRPRRTVTIQVPSDYDRGVPILSAPQPRKKPAHTRHDSALGLPDNDRSRERAAAHRAQEQRDLAQQRQRLALDEDRRRRAEAHDQARQAQLDLDRARSRQHQRTSSLEQHQRQRQAQIAADAAYNKAQKAQLAAQQDAQDQVEYERRLQSEMRARDHERRQTEQQQQQETHVVVVPSSTERRLNRTAIIHNDTSTLSRLLAHPSTPQDIIRREQDNMARTRAGPSAMNDPLREDPWADDGSVVREWASSEDSERRARMRRYRDQERRRLE